MVAKVGGGGGGGVEETWRSNRKISEEVRSYLMDIGIETVFKYERENIELAC